MIIEKLDLVDYIFELVDDIDILDTYRKAGGTVSCMTGDNISHQQRLGFYLGVKDLKLLRLLSAGKRNVVGRALIWTGKDQENKVVRVMDRIYVSTDKAHALFKSCWQKFADVSRDTKRAIVCTLDVKSDWCKNYKLGIIGTPYLDTFGFVCTQTGRVSNQLLPVIKIKKSPAVKRVAKTR